MSIVEISLTNRKTQQANEIEPAMPDSASCVVSGIASSIVATRKRGGEMNRSCLL